MWVINDPQIVNMKNNENNKYNMKNLNTYINEKLTIVHKSYSCAPDTTEELKEILKERLTNDPNADLNDIDVSNIIDMSFLFSGLDPHNIDISKWDVSNTEDMKFMFNRCENFNSDLSGWDVSNAEDIYCMFINCKNFDSDISNWDISNVQDMRHMFNGCDSMKKLPTWYNEN